MKYTSKNIIGVEYTRPSTGAVVWKVVEYRGYGGDFNPDVVVRRSDSEGECFMNGAKWVMECLNNGKFTIKTEMYEIY